MILSFSNSWRFSGLTTNKYKFHYNFVNSGFGDLSEDLYVSWILPAVTPICLLQATTGVSGHSFKTNQCQHQSSKNITILSHSWLFILTLMPQCTYSLLTSLGGHAACTSLWSSVSWSILKIAISFLLSSV